MIFGDLWLGVRKIEWESVMEWVVEVVIGGEWELGRGC